MNTELLIILVLIAVAVLAAAAWYYYRRTTSQRLKERFGPEYDQTVRQLQDRQRAEAELKAREKRVQQYEIVPLPPAERSRYRETWLAIQGRFVDSPKTAVLEANELVEEVMQRCGYPMTNFEQSAADLSVDHPRVVENYRAAYRIAERSRRSAADTEELRQALVYYRALFDELLEDRETAVNTRKRPLRSSGSRRARA